MPTIVVSNIISEHYFNLYGIKPLVQPPVLYNTEHILLLSKENVELIKNDYGIIDTSKITFCICGAQTDRKNPTFFFKLASYFPQYNFIWIGGHKKTKKIINLKNAYHIINIINPYKYFANYFDYFLLTFT